MYVFINTGHFYFILWVISNTIVMIIIILLKFSSIGHWRRLQAGSYGFFLTYYHPFSHTVFLLSETIRHSRVTLYCSASTLGLTFFPRNLIPCIEEWYLEIKMWALSVPIATRMSLCLSPLSRQS